MLPGEDEDFQKRKGKRDIIQTPGSTQDILGVRESGRSTQTSANDVHTLPAYHLSEREDTTGEGSRSIEHPPANERDRGELRRDDIAFMYVGSESRPSPKLTLLLYRVDKFEGYIHILNSDSHSTPRCQHSYPRFPSKPAIEAELRSLCVCIYEMGLEACDKGEEQRARGIFSDLIGCWDEYPELYNVQEGDTLLTTIIILKKLGPRNKYKHLLLKTINMDNDLLPAPRGELNRLLDESFKETSETSNTLLASIWMETHHTNVPLDLKVPSLQIAALDPIPEAIVATLSCSILHLRQVTSSQQHSNEHQTIEHSFDPQIPHDTQRKGATVDVRNFRNRSPLFSAAVKGRLQSCSALLDVGADPDIRDKAGHTVLEVASREGHVDIVALLLARGCNVNPDIAVCASSPLQAALECENFNLAIINILLDHGASVDDKRLCDDKSAVDIARERGLFNIELMMRDKSLAHRHGPFPHVGNNAAQAHR